MNNLQKGILLYGLGVSGQAALAYLAFKPLFAFDSNQALLARLGNEHPQVTFVDELKESILDNINTIIISPGVNPKGDFFDCARARQIEIIGDVEYFLRLNTMPIVAVTGSNGKSTVVSLLKFIADQSGVDTYLAGNIGTPVFDILTQPKKAWLILELSSFQLETITSLKNHLACITNITPDHLDRHNNFDAYKLAKHRIYENAKVCVVNNDDQNTITTQGEVISFSRNKQATMQVKSYQGHDWLFYQEAPFCSLQDLNNPTGYALENIMAALLLAIHMGCDTQKMVAAIPQFKGLPYRCEFIAEQDNIRWFNDSKATNVGASVAAINGVAGANKQLICIMGGLAKDQTFESLVVPLQNHAKRVILMGKDKHLIHQALPDTISTVLADDLATSVQLAYQAAKSGDTVLFSPACASFDQFNNYIERGDIFTQLVKQTLGINHG